MGKLHLLSPFFFSCVLFALITGFPSPSLHPPLKILTRRCRCHHRHHCRPRPRPRLGSLVPPRRLPHAAPFFPSPLPALTTRSSSTLRPLKISHAVAVTTAFIVAPTTPIAATRRRYCKHCHRHALAPPLTNLAPRISEKSCRGKQENCRDGWHEGKYKFSFSFSFPQRS